MTETNEETDRADKVIKDLVFMTLRDGKLLGLGEWQETSEGTPELRRIATVPMTEEGKGLALKTAIAAHYRELAGTNEGVLGIAYTARELGTGTVFKGQYP